MGRARQLWEEFSAAIERKDADALLDRTTRRTRPTC